MRVYIFIFLLFSCSRETPEAPSETQPSSPESEIESAVEVEFSRIITVPGNVTETLFALGHGDRVVGICASSRYPEAVGELPKVGYRGRLNAEGILSLSPDLLIATEEAGPAEVIAQVRGAGIRVEIVSGARSLEGATRRITEIARLLGEVTKGQQLVDEITEKIGTVTPPAAAPKVLFIYVARNMMLVAGSGTAAESMITLAGGVNAVTSFESFKPMNPEALIAANPDFILLDSSGLESIGGVEAVLKLPGVSETRAGRKRQIIAVNKTLLLGFGPRFAEGAVQLAKLLRE